jgi:hydroxymethylbilane synthase
MALHQAALARDLLAAAHPGLAGGGIELVPIRTTGDRILTRQLAEIGGKGLFTKEIEEALIDRRIDLAVHSLKDMETVLPAGLSIGCVLPRDDPRDVLVARRVARLDELPSGAVIGTASLRRQAQMLRRRPDFRIVPIRGNVGTRLAKLASGEVDALVLALCGLARLGHAELVTEILEPEVMLPAVGQGALAIECRAADASLLELLAPLADAATTACVVAERAMLAALDGSCRTPIGGLAQVADGRLHLKGLLLSADGGAERRGEIEGTPAEAKALGKRLGRSLREGAGAEFGFD